MARKNTDEEELIFRGGVPEGPTQVYTPTGKSKQGRRKSYPGEAAYKKRKQYWQNMGFGEDAAKWAAAWRFGEPKKTRGVKTDEERKSIERAIRTAERRRDMIDRIMRSELQRKGRTREEVIAHYDRKLREKDKIRKLADKIKGVEWDTSIYDKSIEPNIFVDPSPE